MASLRHTEKWQFVIDCGAGYADSIPLLKQVQPQSSFEPVSPPAPSPPEPIGARPEPVQYVLDSGRVAWYSEPVAVERPAGAAARCPVLSKLKLSALIRKAKEVGVEEDELEAAEDSDRPTLFFSANAAGCSRCRRDRRSGDITVPDISSHC